MTNLSAHIVTPHRDETLSSWLSRWAGDRHNRKSDLLDMVAATQVELVDALHVEPDYPSAQGWARSVAAAIGMDPMELERIAWAPSPWVLTPQARCSVCVACLGEDGEITAQYMRQLWTDSWRTLCHKHDLPLIRVPAFGWGWGAAPPDVRRTHKTLMQRPYTMVGELRAAWSVTPSLWKDAVYNAEMGLMEAFGEHFAHAGREGNIVGGQLRVWEDLLAACTTNWQPWSDELPLSAPLAAVTTGHRFFKGMKGPPLQGDCNLIRFRSLDEPAIRRMALACVADALLNMASRPEPKVRVKRKIRSIWEGVATTLPLNAWEWLTHRSELWPTTSRHWIEGWRRALHPVVRRNATDLAAL